MTLPVCFMSSGQAMQARALCQIHISRRVFLGLTAALAGIPRPATGQNSLSRPQPPVITPPQIPASIPEGRDIRAFGVRCDGNTDDTAAINAALARGGIFVFPESSQTLISGTILAPANTRLVGYGQGSQIIRSPQWPSRAKHSMLSNQSPAYSSTDKNIIVEGLNFISNSSPSGLDKQSITWMGGSHFVVRDCWFTGGAPVSWIGSTDCTASRLHCLMATGALSPWAGAKRIRLSDIWFENDPAHPGGNILAINADNSETDGMNLLVSDIVASNLLFRGNTGKQAGIEIFPINSRHHNRIENVRLTNIYLDGTGASPQAGLFIGGACSEITVKNIIIERFANNSGSGAVQINAENGTFVPSGVSLDAVSTVSCQCNPAIGLFRIAAGNDITISRSRDYGSRYPWAFDIAPGATNVKLLSNRADGATASKYHIPASRQVSISD